MNNEEKIIGMLEQVMQEVGGLKQEVGGLKQEVGGLKQDLSGVKLHIENVTDKNIRILAEQHDDIIKRIERLSVIDSMQMDIDTLKAAVSYLTNELAEIKKAM